MQLVSVIFWLWGFGVVVSLLKNLNYNVWRYGKALMNAKK
jgi:hypothetical protein